MHILYLTTGFPYPLISGRLRQYHFIRQLSRQHRVTLVALVGKDFGDEQANAVAPIVDRLVTVVAPSEGGTKLARIMRRVNLMLTGTSAEFGEMRRVVARLLKEDPCEAVIFSVSALPALEGLVVPPLVADVCDAAEVHIRSQLEHASRSQAPMLRMALLWAQRLMAKVSKRSSHLLFASRRDLEAAVGESLASATVVANGVDVDYWKRTTSTLGRNTIVFTGSMKYPPNTDAAMLLIHDILPVVRQTVADAELFIVGHSPTPELIEAGKNTPGVHVTGLVDDVRPYLDRAAVFAAPLRFGAGIQNKLLEAMAMEVPVVTSQLAADGLLPGGDVVPPVEVADTPQQFAQAILRRFADCDNDPTPDAAGRHFVREHFTWEGSAQKLEHVLNRVAPVAAVAGSANPSASGS